MTVRHEGNSSGLAIPQLRQMLGAQDNAKIALRCFAFPFGELRVGELRDARRGFAPRRARLAFTLIAHFVQFFGQGPAFPRSTCFVERSPLFPGC